MTYWHETKTKKYHDVVNRIAEKGFAVRFFAFVVGCRGLVGKSLRKFLTALELPKKIIEETLTDCTITGLKCSRMIFLSRSSFKKLRRLAKLYRNPKGCRGHHWRWEDRLILVVLLKNLVPKSLPCISQRPCQKQQSLA
jgi:hypothetical protein